MDTNEKFRCFIRGQVNGDCFSGYLVEMKDAATSPIDWSDDEDSVGSVELVEVRETRETLQKFLSENQDTSNAPSEPYPEVSEKEPVAGLSEGPKRKRCKSKKEPKSTRCTICNRIFSRKLNCIRHMNTHSGTLMQRKIHECDVCRKRFVSDCNLWTHWNSQHLLIPKELSRLSRNRRKTK